MKKCVSSISFLVLVNGTSTTLKGKVERSTFLLFICLAMEAFGPLVIKEMEKGFISGFKGGGGLMGGGS